MDDFNKPEVRNSMIEIFVNLLSFLLLGIIATAVGIVFFQVINKYLPDVLSATYKNYQLSNFSVSAIHYSMASLIVGFPVYLWAIWFWFKSFANTPEKSESRLSRWLIYIILLIAGGVIIGDLITVIYNFLQGEYGARFLLKALTILVIAGLIFGFYFLERKKIQYKKEISYGLFWLVGGMAGLLAVLAIILGFIAGGTPYEARLRNFDLQRANNLQMISSAVSNFAFENSRLPKDLSEIKDNPRYNYGASYVDPETKKNYDYKIINPGPGADGSAEYELCAVFSLSTLSEVKNSYEYNYGQWAGHDKGQVCEKQTVTFGKSIVPIGK
ncbi:MAG: DUF5671 domain-containing protein [Candidatus Azambacteria bacterium]|nr:DUF5671 domain-containing protein [Candidatus Azambacteria bacterium]